MTQHCHQCGWEWPFPRAVGRMESCERCGADLHVCLNCANYDKTVAYQCRDRRAEEVAEKDRSNYCEWFEMARRPFVGKAPDARQDAARDALKRLLGD